MRARMTVLVLVLALGGAACATRTPRPSDPPPRDPVIAVILSAGGRLLATVHGDGSAAPISDGRGGWFLVGTFTRVDGVPEAGLARITARGALDTRFRARAAATDTVAASAGTVYVGSGPANDDEMRVEVLDARTGRPLAPPVTLPASGSALAADARHLYVAGGTPTTSCVTAYDALVRRADVRFAVHMLPEVNCVNAIVLDGPTLYLAGSLGIHARLPGAAVARFAIATGRLDPTFRFPAPCPDCYGLAYTIALGGGHVFVNPGPGSAWLEAVSARTGAVDPRWHAPRLPGYPAPLGLAVAGERLFVLGPVHRGPLARAYGLLTLDVHTGAVLPSWHPPAATAAGPLAASGGRVMVALTRA